MKEPGFGPLADDGAPPLPLVRWAILLGILVGECVLIPYLFDRPLAGVSVVGWLRDVALHPRALQALLATLTALALFGHERLLAEARRMRWTADSARKLRWGLAIHLCLFGILAAYTGLLFFQPVRSSYLAVAWTIGWLTLGGAVLASWCLAILPRQSWARLLRQAWPAVLASVAVGLLAPIASWSAQQLWLWRPLAQSALWAVRALLLAVGADTVCDPSTLSVGTPAYTAEIAPLCSGYQGMGLVTVFLGVFLWVFRRHFRFPHALLLFPIGIALAWLGNVLRLFLLIVIGTWVSPELAREGFHSVAGWIAFLAISLGIMTVAPRVPFLVREPPLARMKDAAAAYILPLLAVVAVALVGKAISPDLDYTYPLRVLAVGGALIVWQVPRGEWRCAAPGLALLGGILVCLLWILLEPLQASHGTMTDVSTHLQGVPPLLGGAWFAFRLVGYIMAAPVAEELAFRGYLMRRFISRDFQEVAPARCRWFCVLVSALAFGALHGQWLAGTAAGVVYGLVYRRTGRLGDAILAHATTNAALAACAVLSRHWELWS